MTEQEFAAKIKQKYPQYANIDDATLTAKMLEKYPEYKTQIKSGGGGNPVLDAMNWVGQAGASATASAGRALGNTAQFAGQATSFLDPIAAAGRIKKTFTGEDFGYTSPVEQLGGAVKGGLDALADNAEDTSVRLAGGKRYKDAQSLGSGLGSVAGSIAGAGIGGAAGIKAGGNIASKLLPQASGFLPKAAKAIGQSFGSTQGAIATGEGRVASPSDLFAGGVIDAGIGLGGGLAKGIRNAAWGNVLRQTPTDKRWLAQKGIDAGEELTKNIGFAPTREAFMNKLGGAVNKAGQNIDEAIKSNPNFNFDTKKIIDTVDDVDQYIAPFQKGKTDLQKIGIRDTVLQEAQALRNKILGSGNTLDDLVRIKREADEVVPYDKVDPLVRAATAPYKAVADRARTLLPENVQMANAKYGPLKALKDIAEKRPTTSGFAGDLLGMAAGPDIKSKLANVAIQRLYRTPAVQTGIASISNKLAQGARSKILNAGMKSLIWGQK